MPEVLTSKGIRVKKNWLLNGIAQGKVIKTEGEKEFGWGGQSTFASD